MSALRPNALGLALVGLALAVAGPARADDFYGGSVRPPEVIDAGHAPVLTKPPALLSRVEPVFPEEARAAKLTGAVTMQVDIGADGRVADAQVLQGAGHGFDEAAVAAIRQFTFSPAEIDNVPAPVRIQYTEHFVFTEPVDAGPPPAPDVDAGPPLLPVSITGHILERGSRKPIVGAAVKVSGIVEPETTVAAGAFELRVPPGHVTITVFDANHQFYQTQEDVKAGERLDVTYFMMPKAFGLYETVVRSERDQKEVTRYTLEREELEEVPGSFGDPLRVLHDMPGVARSPFGLGNLVVEGASPADTGVYMDGVRLPLLYHFLAGPSVVNPEFLDRIDFYPGGFGSEYGRAIGGSVDIKTRSARDDEIHGSAKIDLIDTGVYMSVPITDGLVVSAAARRSYLDAVLGVVVPLISSSGVVVAPSYYDYQLRLDWKPPQLPGNTFNLFFLGSDDLLSVAQSSTAANPFKVNTQQGFQRLAGSWIYHHGALTLTSQPFIGLDQNSAGVGTAEIDTPAKVAGLREKAELQLDKTLFARAGLDDELTDAYLTIYAPTGSAVGNTLSSNGTISTTSTTFDRNEFEYGEWAELEWNTPFGTKITPGLRADEYKVGAHWNALLEPRFSVRQKLPLPGELVLKASSGLYNELPPISDLTGPNESLALPPQQAVQNALGFEARLIDRFHLDVTGFYNWRFDLAESTSPTAGGSESSLASAFAGAGGFGGGFGRAGTGPAVAATGRGRAYGVQVLLKHDLTQHLFGWIAYTLSWSQEDAIPGQGFKYTAYDQRHILIAVAQYKFGNGWELGGRFQLTSGTPTTAVSDSTFIADSGSYTPLNGPTNGARLPLFNQLDLRVDRVFVFERWTLGLYLDVQNVYNQQNQEFVIYDYRYRTTQVVPDIPILPTLGVKGTF